MSGDPNPKGAERRKLKLLSVDDLLTPAELKQLRHDLAVMARQRRDAENFAATFRFGSGASRG